MYVENACNNCEASTLNKGIEHCKERKKTSLERMKDAIKEKGNCKIKDLGKYSNVKRKIYLEMSSK